MAERAYIVTKGVVLRETETKEADKIRIQTIRKNAPQEVHAASSCSPLALMP